jgi:hypothetical protein
VQQQLPEGLDAVALPVLDALAELIDGLEPLLAVDGGVRREEHRRRGLDAAVDFRLSEIVEVALVAQFLLGQFGLKLARTYFEQ